MRIVGTATEFKLKKCDTWLKHNVVNTGKNIFLKKLTSFEVAQHQ
jgi:hypothetical protein